MRCAVFVLAGLVLSSEARAQSESYAFLSRLGRDTVAVEQVTRSPGRLEGRTVERAPRVATRHYIAELAPDGAVRRFEQTIRIANPAPGAPREQHVTVEFGGDSLAVTIRAGDSTRSLKLAAVGSPIPWILYAYGTYELIFASARRRGGDSVSITTYSPGARGTANNFVRRVGTDSLVLGFFGDPVKARVDREGRLLGLSGEQTTIKVRVERLPSADVEAIARAFAATEASVGAASALSPRDTARAAAGAAQIWVDYGRPAVRGRTVLGGLVPYDQVWRTGANAATQFSTSVDLAFGDLVVPAGKYTLWSLPTRSGVSLIVNRQTGQWGTQYNAAQDLGRVAMQVEPMAGPVEVFIIRIESSEGRGRLVMEWDRQRWVAPFSLR